jgi:hypothetical protein
MALSIFHCLRLQLLAGSMKKLILFIVTFICGTCTCAPAAVALNLKVRAIYEKAAFSSQTFLPFVIFDVDGQPVRVVSVTMGQFRSSCGMVLDPYRPGLFLVKCVTPVEKVDFNIVVEVGGQVFQTTYGPIAIGNPYANLDLLKSGPPISDPDILLGQQLFGSHCISCHIAKRPPATTTVLKIKTAMKTVPNMQRASILKTLTDAQLEAIAKFLGTTK